jgi:hypothetical protein
VTSSFDSTPTLSGDDFVGGTVVCATSITSDAMYTLDFAWSNGTDTGNVGSLTLGLADEGTMVTCTVTLTDQDGTSEATTAPWGPIRSGPPTPPSVTQPGQFVVSAQRDAVALPVEANVSVYHNDSWSLVFLLLDDAGTTHDLTDAIAACSVSDSSGDVTALTVDDGTDPTMGQVSVAAPEAGLDPGVYVYDLEVDDGDGTALTWVRGQLVVTADVTP